MNFRLTGVAFATVLLVAVPARQTKIRKGVPIL